MFDMKKNIVLIMIILALFANCNSLLFAGKNKEKHISYVGKWVFHSIMTMDGKGRTKFLNAEEYLNTIPDHIDKKDPVSVADEQRERKYTVDSIFEICEDGMMYMLIPLPEDIPQEEIDKAVSAGEITLRNGMITSDKPHPWEDRNGELWVQTGMADFFDGQGQRPNWEKCVIEDGLLTFLAIRYKKTK